MRQLNPALQRTTYSFRRISPAAAAAEKPNRLPVVQASTEASASALVPRMAGEKRPRERFIVLNGLNDNGVLGGRERVKVVTG